MREQDNYVLVDLMKVFMVSQDHFLILQLIQKILDFKTWVKRCLKDGPKILVGHTNMYLFHFFVDSIEWPVMQYRVSPTNVL